MVDLTLNESEALDKVFRKSASSALIEWGLEGELEDLVQDLWVWFLERPSTQRKFQHLSNPERITTAKIHAHQLLSEKVLSGNVASGKPVYSVDSVKDALAGNSTNRHLRDLLPLGMSEVQSRDDTVEDRGEYRGYAESIRLRYDDAAIPEQGSDAMRLSRALAVLTDEINVIFLTVPDRGRDVMFPDMRKPSGSHSDPTGNASLALIENPELRDDFFEELPLDLALKGEYAQPVRRDVQRNTWVRDVPIVVVPGAVPALETCSD